MTDQEQHEPSPGGTNRCGYCGRVPRAAVFVAVALLVCLLTVSLAGTAAAQQTISNANDLDKIRNDIDGDFVLTSDIDMNNYNGDFSPIGANQAGQRFVGTLDGQGNEIKNLNINENSRNVGLFAAAGTDNNAFGDTIIKNIGIVNADVTGDAPTGILIGVTDDSQSTVGQSVNITNVYVEGSATGGPRGSLSEPEEGAGGLIGYAGEGVNAVNIRASHAIVDVNATGVGSGDKGTAGGLVGVADTEVLIEDSWSDGSVRIENTGQDAFVEVGGVVGSNLGGTIRNSFSIADVFGESSGIGSGISDVGGVVGENQGSVMTSFAAGSVGGSGVDNVGGFIGDNKDTATGSYFDEDTTGQTSGVGTGGSGGVTGLSTSQMQDTSASANMVAFNFPDEWRERPGDYPVPAGVFPASVVGTNEPIQSGEAVIGLNVAYSGPGSINNFGVGILIDGGTDSSGRHTDSISLSRNGETTTTLTNDNVGSGNASLDVQYLDPQTWTIIQDTLQVESSPTADAGGPYTVDEGGSVTLDGTGSSDPDGSIVAYRWDLDGDGSFEATGSTTTFDASGIDGTTSVNVELEVEDDSGNTDTDSATVDVSNVAPSVSADNDPVVVDEGQTATNTGSHSDPVDSVTVTANPGTITDDSGGTWSWEYDTTDDDDSTTVFVNAFDGEDTTTTSFGLTVNNVAPTLTVDNDPVAVNEGETATNTGTYSDPVDSVSLSASRGTVTKTGGGNWEWSYDTSDNDDTGPVTITATDDETSTSKTFQLNVDNVAPTIDSVSLPSSADEGETIALDASFSDPGSDTHTATVDWGDGTTESASVDQSADTLSASHTYGDDGSYTVTVTVTDDDGGADSDSATVDVSNVAPSVSADNGTVTVDEGQTATNTGSYSDPVDPVSLSASTGTVTDEGSGTWSWSYPTSDGPDDGETVTITADDGDDTSSVSFDLTVNNVAPSVTIDSLPGTADEGETVALDASFSDTDADTHTATVDWGDGTTESVSVDQTNDVLSSSHTYDDNGSYTVNVTVEDDDGGSGSDSATVDVSNVAPSVTIDSLPSSADEGETIALDASFSDPGSDTHSATVDWGDGTTESVSVDQTNDMLSSSHTYTDNGSYTVTVTVEDDDGGSGSDSATVDVSNAAPTVTIDSIPSTVDKGENVTLNASFSDPSSADTHTATVDWGDGTNESVSVNQTNDTLSASHAYDDDGDYTVNVTVTDDDGATGSANNTVSVQPDCLNPREVSRGQEDQECPRDRVIERGEDREELDRETDRRSDTKRQDRSRRGRGR